MLLHEVTVSIQTSQTYVHQFVSITARTSALNTNLQSWPQKQSVMKNHKAKYYNAVVGFLICILKKQRIEAFIHSLQMF